MNMFNVGVLPFRGIFGKIENDSKRGARFGPMSMSMFDFVSRLGIGSTFCSLFLSFFIFFLILFETELCVFVICVWYWCLLIY